METNKFFRLLSFGGRSFFTFSLSIFLCLSLGACAKVGDAPLTTEPGIEGSFFAIGADVGRQRSVPLTVDFENGTRQFVIETSETAGYSIGKAIDGPTPEFKNEGRFFIPASITKVVTAALALEAVGPDFRFTTELNFQVRADGRTLSDLIILSDGDPQIADEEGEEGPGRTRIAEMVAALKARGIKKVVGRPRLMAVDERLNLARVAEGLEDEDHLECYGAVAVAFNFNQNCARLVVTGLRKGHWEDRGIAFPFNVQLKKASKALLSIVPEFGADRAVIRYLVGGSWSGDPVSQKLPVPDTRAWFANAFLKELGRQGLKLEESKDVSAEGAPAIQERLRIESDPLSDLERYMNKESDNFLADAIFKAVAVREKDKTSDLREVASFALRESLMTWMKNQGHPEYADEVHLIDGAGLSRSNRVTPRAFLALLREFSKHPSFPVLWNSLPIAGVDGTLKNRMKKTAAEGIARAKTGTLRGAYQLAGYIPLGDPASPREYIPFVLLSAATAKEKDEVRAFQDKLVAKVTARLRE